MPSAGYAHPHIGAVSGVYCERAGEPGLWVEPLNLVTNLAFLLGAAAALRVFLRQSNIDPRRDLDLLALILVFFAIGIGSSLWHSFASRWAELLDVIPILIFIHGFLLLHLLRVLRLSAVAVVVALLVYEAVNLVVAWNVPPELFNGALYYAPTWAFLLLLGLDLRRRGDTLARAYLAGWLLLTGSLFFRALDQYVCEALPIGTHFLWHLLNGLLLYLLLSALVRQRSNTRAHSSCL